MLENNPGAWGSRNPVVLMLGFSKGANQTARLRNTPYDEVPFRGMRRSLTNILHRLHLLPPDADIDSRINAAEKDFAFGSLIRCSISKEDGSTGRYIKSGNIINALAQGECETDFAVVCAGIFLRRLPARLRLILMLSNDDVYVDSCERLLAGIHSGMRRVNAVAYRTDAIWWVHVIHPSGASGKHIRDWLAADAGKQAVKRDLAIAAVRAAMGQVS